MGKGHFFTLIYIYMSTLEWLVLLVPKMEIENVRTICLMNWLIYQRQDNMRDCGYELVAKFMVIFSYTNFREDLSYLGIQEM